MSAAWMHKWFDRDVNPRPKAAPFMDEAWEIAKTVAAVDKQLLSSQAVEAFANLAALAQEETSQCYSAHISALESENARLREALEQARTSLQEHRCGTGSCHCCRSIAAIDAALGRQG